MAIRTCVGGNIIAPVEFFEYDRRFYQSTKWRQIKAKTLEEISSLSDTTKEVLMKTAAQNLKVVHSKGIIHFDIKPDNLPVSINEFDASKLVCTLMDFDSSHFDNLLPAPEVIAVTPPYMSPELAAYTQKNHKYGDRVTAKNDVFALAIVFHEYWTGRKFIYRGSEDKDNGRYLYQAVDEGENVSVAPSVPDWLENLLMWMIKKNPDERPTMAEVLDALKDHSKIPGEDPRHEDEEAKKRKLEEIKKRKLEETQKRKMEEHFAHHTGSGGYTKGPKFPSDANSFEVLSNGNIKIMYHNGSKVVYNRVVAVRKGFVQKD